MKKENGAIMVEAVLIFPLVIATVMALIYLGLFKLQDMAMLYQVQKVAIQADYVVSSPGYQKLGTLDAYSFDFNEEPSQAAVSNYYKAYYDKASVLYREITGCTWTNSSIMTEYAGDVMKSLYIFMGFDAVETKVDIDRVFLTNTITVTTEIKYPMPGILRYLGLGESVLLHKGATVSCMNPADFIRDVDMAWDGTKAIAKLLNIDLDGIVGKCKEIITFL